MKAKWLTAGILAVSIAGLGMFAACDGGDGGEGGGGGTNQPTTYAITAAQSSDYTITAPASAEAGETVNVSVAVNNAEKYVTGVTYNGSACLPVGGAENSYAFTMPAANVTLAAALGTYEETLSDEYLSFASFVPDTISVYENTWGGVDHLYFDLAQRFNNATYELSSSNQSVIPDSALDVSFDKDGTGVLGGSITVAVNDIRPGTAYVTFTLRDGSTRRENTIVKKLTVVAEGELQVETTTVTFTFNAYNVRNDIEVNAEGEYDFYFNISDFDYIYGGGTTTHSAEYRIIDVSDDWRNITVTMTNFAVGHRYLISGAYWNGYMTSFTIDDLTTADAALEDGILTVTSDTGISEFGTIILRPRDYN